MLKFNAFAIFLFINILSASGQSVISNVIDIEGNTYKVIQIGNQYWMAENLRVSKLNDNTPLKLAKNADSITFEPSFYQNSEKKMAGYVYNIGLIINDKNVCPIGWHIPSHKDWGKLEQFLGMTPEEVEAYSGDIQNRGQRYGNKLKSISGWGSVNGTDDYGFNALKDESCWWTSTPDISSYDLNYVIRILPSHNSNIELWRGYENAWCNIRCVKDSIR